MTTTLSPSVGDPWLRAQLPAAVLARPLHDGVPRHVWWEVARCLEVTGHAVACAQEGSDPSTTAALAGAALRETAAAQSSLGTCPPGPDRRHRAPSVERTWFRLAGLLAGPAPADPRVLAHVLADHAAALSDWRGVLRGPGRLAA